MAYSAGAQVIELSVHLAAEAIVKASVGVDLSASTADEYALPVPLPLLVYAFGVYVTEALAAAVTGSIVIEHAPTIGGTAVAICDFDLDSTNLKKGNGTRPLITAATGSEDLAVDNVAYAQSSAFPVLIPAPRFLTVRHVQTSVAGEVVPFIIARWMPIDLRSTEAWGNIS